MDMYEASSSYFFAIEVFFCTLAIHSQNLFIFPCSKFFMLLIPLNSKTRAGWQNSFSCHKHSIVDGSEYTHKHYHASFIEKTSTRAKKWRA